MRAGFKYCALHYLNQWIEQDRPCCDALAGRDDSLKLQALAKVAAQYGIARTLPKRYDVKNGLQRYRPVLEIIDAQKRADFQGDNLVPSIMKVSKEISKKYGGHGSISLTTKLLWMKMKSPIIIYDSRARTAVGTALGDLAEYYEEWRKRFTPCDDQIRDACASLSKVHEYVENPEIATVPYIEEITAHAWFRERVFDFYLWGGG
jgi:hypothetical protein